MTRPVPRSPRPRQADPALDAAVGARIAARRQGLGLSQAALAGRIGVSFQQLQKYESGTNRISASRLHHLAQALGAPVGAFFPDGEPPLAPPAALTLLDTPEGRRLASGFSRIRARATRRALAHLVEALAAADPPPSRA
ncbi:MAG TPA: helix-turn-helix transcriptional regulator [Brevundimonas sp.]|uniref:helix-turn-helix domain-containing protein n=1 Tax=Brevundimonas sp. TaxID=1871086 RepID=UPI002E0F98D7|nr:helix-turn-helix transcriptional regulator [Brevundimonas sp.]